MVWPPYLPPSEWPPASTDCKETGGQCPAAAVSITGHDNINNLITTHRNDEGAGGSPAAGNGEPDGPGWRDQHREDGADD